MPKRNWSEYELQQTLLLYCILPFGKMHSKNSEVIELARKINRTPSAVAMKLVNFASLDPKLIKRGVKGLSNISALDRKVWFDFSTHWTTSVEASLDENLYNKIKRAADDTEGVAQAKTRKVQAFFRKAVLSSYNEKCCICSLSHPKLLCASHIIPWNMDKNNRANPSNGLCLCAIHDRAFDRGLITIDKDYHIIGASDLTMEKCGEMCINFFNAFIGRKIVLPDKFLPDADFLIYHNENIFLK